LLPGLLFLLAWFVAALPASGQEPLPEIFVSGNDITVPPSVVLHVYGRDEQGAAIDFNERPLTVTQDGVTVPATVSGGYPAGTLTVFLIDIPTGVEAQLPAMQQAIQQFAGPGGGMQESVDAVAIYQAGQTEAVQLLAPTMFYNEVQNFFGDGLTPELGSTALIDSVASLIPQIEGLKPNAEMAASVVVMSDGTDVVSTQSTAQDVVSSAIQQHLPLHTIWVSSADLTTLGQEQGQTYLQEAAAGTRGVAAVLGDAAGLSSIWNRIVGFRDHARVSYVSEGGGGGAFDVTVSLASDPAVSDAMFVEIPQNQPQVALDIPAGSNTLTLPNLDEPVLLRMGAAVTWLDGIERAVTSARLKVNGEDVVDVPADQLQDFTVEVSNFQYGPNTLELFVTDEQGLQAANLPQVITIAEGEQDIPEELQPPRELGSTVLDIFMALVVLGVLAGLFYWLRRKGLFRMPRGRSGRSGAAVTYTSDDGTGSVVPDGQEHLTGVPFQATLDIIEALSEMPAQIELGQSVIRLGRSPAHCDIAFRDDLTVSRQHAVLMLEGNHFRLFDENSTSGTWVNGRQVPEYGMELADGDEIHLGAVHLLYRQPYAY